MSLVKAITLWALLVLLVSSGIEAQTTVPVVQARIASAIRVDHQPRLDGTLDDPLWQLATPIVDFRQREPFEGQPATERTEVRILYSRDEVYFGIVCHDSSPQGIVATQLRRDVSQEFDDYFEILIDSRHDRRNAYLFQINPLGTQRDGLIVDEQVGDTQDGDPGWDGVWTSETKVRERVRYFSVQSNSVRGNHVPHALLCCGAAPRSNGGDYDWVFQFAAPDFGAPIPFLSPGNRSEPDGRGESNRHE